MYLWPKFVKSMQKTIKLYPDSGIELSLFSSSHYDKLMNVATFGAYSGFIQRAIEKIAIQPSDSILDLGCGTGRNACLMHKYLSGEGHITGLDISEVMGKQFKDNCAQFPNVDFRQHRIDIPFDLEETYDKVFISFVLHGFPQEVRKAIIDNAYRHLKPEGEFCILDYSEFNLANIPFFHRFVFRKIECKYAFDYIEKDWKEILSGYGFGDFSENFFMKRYVRLLKAGKVENSK